MFFEDFMTGAASGTYAFALFHYGREIWWLDGDIMNSVRLIQINLAWKLFGILISFFPLCLSLVNIVDEMRLLCYVMTLGVFYAFKESKIQIL